MITVTFPTWLVWVLVLYAVLNTMMIVQLIQIRRVRQRMLEEFAASIDEHAREFFQREVKPKL